MNGRTSSLQTHCACGWYWANTESMISTTPLSCQARLLRVWLSSQIHGDRRSRKRARPPSLPSAAIRLM